MLLCTYYVKERVAQDLFSNKKALLRLQKLNI